MQRSLFSSSLCGIEIVDYLLPGTGHADAHNVGAIEGRHVQHRFSGFVQRDVGSPVSLDGGADGGPGIQMEHRHIGGGCGKFSPDHQAAVRRQIHRLFDVGDAVAILSGDRDGVRILGDRLGCHGHISGNHRQAHGLQRVAGKAIPDQIGVQLFPETALEDPGRPAHPGPAHKLLDGGGADRDAVFLQGIEGHRGLAAVADPDRSGLSGGRLRNNTIIRWNVCRISKR